MDSTLEAFHKANPSFLWVRDVVRVHAQGFERYGLFGSTRNTFYAVVLSYAAYGWLASHQQEEDGDNKKLALKEALGKNIPGFNSGN
eukprot:CAMPEP_0171841300 /NCGR_PEP_ID=MMETSP0992-20121227/14494_1 /TAXON_ID=483369 /ORGANISM="non described non described, Strain CCMP2098" /LENGTH=86 /DNA_ID=CAMNT_0012458283 /DNA_START=131 /DNA_END=392 /DNA_ORIENTATION=+